MLSPRYGHAGVVLEMTVIYYPVGVTGQEHSAVVVEFAIIYAVAVQGSGAKNSSLLVPSLSR